MPAAEDDAEVGGVPVEEHLVAVSGAAMTR